jgi:RHS repeat-associated protein
MSRRRFARSVVSAILVIVAVAAARRIMAATRLPCIHYCVAVTPDGASATLDVGSEFDEVFTVTNNGDQADSYDYPLNCTGGASCTVTAWPNTDLNPSESSTLTVHVTMAGANGRITMKALGVGHDSGWKDVTVVPVVSVMPAATQGDTALVYSRMPQIQARFFPNDTYLDTTTLVVVVGSDTVTSLTRYNRGLVEWELDSLRQLTAGVPKRTTVRICLTNGQCKTTTRYLKLDDSGKPWVSFAGMPWEAQGRVFSAPFGAFSVSGADVDAGFSVPGYISMNTGRSAGLVYSTRQSHPRALVNADIELTWPAGTPDQIKAVLIDGTSRMDSTTVSSPSCAAAVGRRCRIALQADFGASTFTSATSKWMSVEVSVTSSGTTKTTTQQVEVVLVDRRASPYGSGWFVGGVMRLDSTGTDRILIGPTGTAAVFRGQGGKFIAPPGDYSVLAWTGSVWELRFRGGGKLVFDAQGRQTKAVDLDANEITIAYSSTSDRVTSITDPMGKQFTFSYDGSSRLSAISNNGVQSNAIVVNGANLLTYDSTSSPTATPYTETFRYDTTYGSGSNGTVMLRKRLNAVGDTTILTYTTLRPTQVSLPAVLSETGSSFSRPVIQYAPQEMRAYHTIVSADNIYVTITDPLSHWTRSALNRWGAAVTTWDTLGTLSRASYRNDGLLMWSEGKVADSTRVNQHYDSQGRLIRTWRLRASNDTLRIDSLVYDANSWVIKRIDALGHISQVDYDGEGHAIRTITPTHDTTRYWYSAAGLLDSTRAPLQTKSSSVRRDAAWSNDSAGVDPDGRTLFVRTFDTLGRVSESQRPVVVRQASGTTYYEWTRTLVTRNAAGQSVSSKVEKATESTSGAGSWPSSSDRLRYDSVYVTYSRLGRDSLRVNVSDKATRVLLDALGRPRIRAPWYTDYASDVDSFRYDLAGNLRHQWTRRGVHIEYLYDSRNRDTLTIVPGVGTYRHTYGGPNDEMTRAWIDSYVDSIGGVDPEVRWGYGQAGQLLADTAQGGRTSLHHYDRYGRDTSATDLNGTWRYRYEAARGYLDTIITPFADSVAYIYDFAGRRTGPTIYANGSTPMSGIQYWSLAGQLTAFGFSTSNYTLGNMANLDTADVHTTHRRGWQEQHGHGAAVGTAEDSLYTDGFERVTEAALRRNDTVLVRETFTFDRDGGIYLNNDSRTYDGAQRMTARSGISCSYDAAGNLTAAGNWTYGYDGSDRMVSARYSGTLVARYAYDVLGRRIARRIYNAGPNSAATGYLRMIYSGGVVAAEADSAGVIAVRYTWGLGADDLVGIRDSSSGTAVQYYVGQDPIGSVRGITRLDGTWIASLRYRSYGQMLDSAGAIPVRLRYRWIGREFDAETGLYYVRARYYDPESQRFAQEDPSGFSGGPNLYAYGDGNPTNGRDLSGLEKLYFQHTFSPHCRTDSCSSAWDATGDWNQDGVDDDQEFADYWQGVQNIRRSLRESGDHGSDARVVYLSIVHAARSLNIGAQGSDGFMANVVQALATGVIRIDYILPNAGLTTKGVNATLTFEMSLFTRRDRHDVPLSRNLRGAVAHEFFHLMNHTMIMFKPGTSSGDAEHGRQDAQAECFAVAVTGVVPNDMNRYNGYRPGCRY